MAWILGARDLILLSWNNSMAGQREVAKQNTFDMGDAPISMGYLSRLQSVLE